MTRLYTVTTIRFGLVDARGCFASFLLARRPELGAQEGGGDRRTQAPGTQRADTESRGLAPRRRPPAGGAEPEVRGATAGGEGTTRPGARYVIVNCGLPLYWAETVRSPFQLRRPLRPRR